MASLWLKRSSFILFQGKRQQGNRSIRPGILLTESIDATLTEYIAQIGCATTGYLIFVGVDIVVESIFKLMGGAVEEVGG
jgi:hypothetical protein